jgi:acyl-CoA thioester hydrolase
MELFANMIKLRIDWNDIDQFKHVNNISVLRYIQSSRVSYCEKIGIIQMHSAENKGPVIASINTQFIKPLFYPGSIIVYSKIGTIKNTSFEIIHLIYNNQNEITTEARDIMVFYDFTKNTKIKLTDSLKEKIMCIENTIEVN